MINAHTSTEVFYGILANDLFYCPVAINLRLKNIVVWVQIGQDGIDCATTRYSGLKNAPDMQTYI